MRSANRGKAAVAVGLAWAAIAAGTTGIAAAVMTAEPTSVQDEAGNVISLKTTDGRGLEVVVACAAVGFAAGVAGSAWRFNQPE